MNQPPALTVPNEGRVIRWLTFMMFMMFAMATDSVGLIIPRVIEEFDLSMTAAGAFHYAGMAAIALSGILLGHLADRLGRKPTIVLGLALFSVNSYLFIAGETFPFFLALIIVSGVAIGIFKTGALALIGDICRSTTQHTTTMNAVEGFFGVGAILGPAIVAYLLAHGSSWKWLYVIAGTLSVVLLASALFIRYPQRAKTSDAPIDLRRTLRMMRDRYALAFSIGAFLYVAVESAIYVWMPTLLADYQGSAPFMATYALAIFFVLRAGGRFLGTWILARFSWTAVLMLFSLGILLCFAASLAGGVDVAVYVLPLSGLFMSVIYPTINSKGISCFRKSQHGAVAGVLLFFTCAGAALGPLAMGTLGDAFGHPRFGFVLATGFAALLCAGLLLNWMFDPGAARLRALEHSEYQTGS